MRHCVLLLPALALLAACEGERGAAHGAQLVREYGCGACHSIPGIRAAHGTVGPPLDFWSRRTYIAGRVPNTPENLAAWILDPHSVDPKTAMPSVGLTEDQARDVVAYLYTLE